MSGYDKDGRPVAGNLDLYFINGATRRGQEYAADVLRKTRRILEGEETASQVARRHAYGFCRWCYYRSYGGLAGQAFTDYACWHCKEVKSWPNTGVPLLCPECVKATGLCARCCGDLDGKPRTELP